MKTIYLVDFDGTITIEDTLDRIAGKFFPEEAHEWGRKIMSGEYSIFQWLSAFEKRFDIDKEDYDDTLDLISIDESFIQFAKKNEVVIVSGGFIYNIKRILQRYEIEVLEIYGNALEYIDNNRVKISTDYRNNKCGTCGVCKTEILEKYRKDYERIVFIGDGITDLCVSQTSDKIYAREGLYLDRYLTEKGIEHITFKSFNEIR